MTSEERSKLGITMDRASGKYYLASYGSPKVRRNSTRRGSQSSSDGDVVEQQHIQLNQLSQLSQHAVLKEVGDILAAEMEAAGEYAEVQLLKSRPTTGSARGSKVINFSVSIRRRSTGGSGGVSGRGEGAAPGRALAHTRTQAADGIEGKPTPPAPRRRASSSSASSDAGARQSTEELWPTPAGRRDSAPTLQATRPQPKPQPQQPKPQQPKPRGRPASSLGGSGGGASNEGPGGAGASGFPSQDVPKRRKSITHTVFGNAPRIGATGVSVAKQEMPQTTGSGTQADARPFGRATPKNARPRKPIPAVGKSNGQMSFLPGRVATMIQSTTSPAMSTAGHFGAAGAPRSQGFSSPSPGLSSWNHTYHQRAGMGASNGVSAQQTRGPTAGVPVAAMSTAPPLTSWQLHAEAMMRTDEFGTQGGGRTNVGVMNTTATATQGVSGPLSMSQQQQLNLTAGGTTFGLRAPSQTMGRVSPTTMFVPESQAPISTLNAYSAQVRQQSQSTGASNTHGVGGPTARMGGLSCGREPDEEDMDFLASFF